MTLKGIVYDNKGEYFAEFFDPEKDMLFNPLDQRSLGWNLFNELCSYPDLTGLVRLKNYDFALSKWRWEPARPAHPPFILRNDLVLENIILQQQRVKDKLEKLKKDAFELNLEKV